MRVEFPYFRVLVAEVRGLRRVEILFMGNECKMPAFFVRAELEPGFFYVKIPRNSSDLQECIAMAKDMAETAILEPNYD